MHTTFTAPTFLDLHLPTHEVLASLRPHARPDDRRLSAAGCRPIEAAGGTGVGGVAACCCSGGAPRSSTSISSGGRDASGGGCAADACATRFGATPAAGSAWRFPPGARARSAASACSLRMASTDGERMTALYASRAAETPLCSLFAFASAFHFKEVAWPCILCIASQRGPNHSVAFDHDQCLVLAILSPDRPASGIPRSRREARTGRRCGRP